jgi:hypothetical protein
MAWAHAEIDQTECKTFTRFKRRVLDTLQNVPVKVLKGLIGSLKSRMVACIKNNGGKTKY